MRRKFVSGFSIAEVSRQTAIPVSTLRFYEKELPGLLPIRKTAGGHRRYLPVDVARLAAVRGLIEGKGLKLADVRKVMISRGEAQPLREETDRLEEILRGQSESIGELQHRLSRLEAQVNRLEARAPRRWFHKD